MRARSLTALQYALIYTGTGVTLPYAGLWLRSQGLSGAEIGVILAAPMLGRLVTGPAIAVWADGFRLRRTPMALLALATAVAYALAGVVDGFLAWAFVWFIAATGAATLIPLADVLTMRLSRKHGFAFAVPRGFGSLAFVLTNVVMGVVLRLTGADAVIVAVALAYGLAALAAWRLLPTEPVLDDPAGGAHHSPLERFKGMGRLLRDRYLVLALLAVGLVQSAHAFYYGFSAILWQGRGIGPEMTGLLWAFAVGAEIAFMWLVEPWRKRAGIGPWPLLVFGAVAAVVRWIAMSTTPSLIWLWPLQALHALTFAATYLAGVEVIDRLAPRESHTAAQTLNSVLSSGVLIGLATLGSGPLYDAFGATGYWAMVVMAVLGLAAGLPLRQVLKGQRAPV